MTSRPLPKYMPAVLALGASLPPDFGVRVVEVRHDLWCPLLTQDGPCTCEPEVVLGPPVEETH